MRTRKLGRSGIEVGEVGLGTWGLSGEGYGPIHDAEVRLTIEAALDAGVNFIDTAHCYGVHGEVETAIGEVLRARGRDKAFVATRVGVERVELTGVPRKRFDRASLVAMTDETLRRLGSDHVDALLLHNPLADTLQYSDAIGTLQELRAQGKARLIGVSVGSVDVGRVALKHEIDLISVPYNCLYPKLLHSLAAQIAGSGAGVIAHTPLAYGMLADTWGANRVFGLNDHRPLRWGPVEMAKRARQREAVRVAVRGHIGSMREAALRYVLCNKLVSVVVPGARNPEHAITNARAAEEEPYLLDDDLTVLGKTLMAEGVEF